MQQSRRTFYASGGIYVSTRELRPRSPLVPAVNSLVFVALGTLAFSALVASAQIPGRLPESSVVSASPATMDRVGVDLARPKTLTVTDVIVLVLKNNRDVESSRIDLETAGLNLQAAKGVYDPTIGASAFFDHQETPVSSILGGTANGKLIESHLEATPTFSGLLPWGGSYQASFSNSRTTSNNVFIPLNAQFPSSLLLQFTQPLFRNRRTDESRRRIEVARHNMSMSDQQFREQLIDTVTNALNAYWSLSLELQNLSIQTGSLQEAQRLVDSVRRQSQQGIRSPIDVTESENRVQTLAQNVSSAKETVTRAENALKVLITPDRNSPLWSQPLIPTGRAELPEGRSSELHMSLDEAIRTALEKRPEIGQWKISSEVNQTNIRYQREQTKPQIDLTASYTASGLSGHVAARGPNPLFSANDDVRQRTNILSQLAGLPPLPPSASITVPDVFVGGYDQSLANLLEQRFPSAHVGLQFSLPLHNRVAEANLALSMADAHRLKNQRQRIELTIEADVRNALQAVHSAQETLAAARDSEKLASDQYASELRRFQAGISSVFLVLQRQDDLTEAHDRSASALATLRKNVTGLERAVATTLDVHNIVITNPRTGQTQYRNATPANPPK